MSLIKGYKQLIEEARQNITTLSLSEAKIKFEQGDIVFIDIREEKELHREGMIPHAFHVPRGMLEFWVDPDSPYYREIFSSDKEYVLYCQSAWRSSLAAKTLVEMGFKSVSHIEGGFRAWKNANLPVEVKK